MTTFDSETAIMDALQKIPPQSLEAEQAVLGAILLEPVDAIPVATELLQPSDFYREAHRQIYEACLAIQQAGDPVDLVTLVEYLKARDQVELVGGTLYLTTILHNVPTAAAIGHYCRIVRNRACRRKLIGLAERAKAGAWATDRELEDVLDEVEAAIMQLSDASRQEQTAIRTVGDVLREGRQQRELADALNRPDGYTPKLAKVRALLKPISRGDYWVVGGAPSLGKSILAMQFGVEMAEQGAKVLFVSQEMVADALASRLVQATTGRDAWTWDSLVYRKNHPDRAYGAWDDAICRFSNLPLAIVDQPGLTPENLVRVARRARHALGGLDVVIVDYMQLLAVKGGHRINTDTERMTAISRGLKEAAMHAQVGLIAVSSLNRATEAAGKPSLSRLRGSGQIEFDADAAMFLHRPTDDRSHVQLLLDKQRHGPVGEVDLYFNAKRLWFYEQAGEAQE